MSFAGAQSLLNRSRYRIAQGLDSIAPRVPPDRNAILSANLSAEQRRSFLELSSVDQAHLLRVYRALKNVEPNASPDLLVAALLHDIGKVSADGRVRLIHRVLRVALAKFSPPIWQRLSALPARGWRTGFVLAEHHPSLGARVCERLGCSEQTCWLIEHHGTRTFPIADPDLRRLVEADYHAR